MIIPEISELNNSKKKGFLYINKHYPEFAKYIQQRYPDINKFNAGIYLYFHNIEQPLCPICGHPVPFLGEKRGFQKYCSAKCANSDPTGIQKRKETNLKKYGVTSPAKNKDIKKKLISTYIKKHGGMGNASSGVKEKQQITMKKLYNTPHALQDPVLKQKMINTNILRHDGIGTGSEEISRKIQATNKTRYGISHVLSNEEVRRKIVKTNLERYGVEHYNNPEKAKHTNIERYGVEYASQSDTIKEKAKHTNIERYGVEYASQSDTIKEKAKQTNLERYGVEYASQSDTIKEKVKQTKRQFQINTHPDLLGYVEDGSWICKCPDPECNRCTEKCYITTNQIYYGRLKRGTKLCTHLLPIQPQFSTFELEIREYLDSLNVAHQDNIRGIIGPKELDIYIPDKKLAIECNGSYWHSIECGEDRSDPNYHIDKYLKCKEKGIKLITIWDDWWAQNRSECEALIQYHLGLINEFHPTHLPTDTTDTNLHPTDNVVPVKVNHSGFDCWVGRFQE